MGARVSPRALALALGAALAAAWLLTADQDVIGQVEPSLALAPPGEGAVLGRDPLGRPIAARLLRAVHAFTAPGLGAAALSGGLGLALGGSAGWWGGARGAAAGWASDVLGAVPGVVWALLLALVLGPGPASMGLALGLATAPALADGVRHRVGALRRAGFVEASLGHGISAGRVLGVHLLVGACGGLVLRHLVTVFAASVGLETTLAYLDDLGTQEPEPSWGNLIARIGPHPEAHPVSRAAAPIALWAVLAALDALADRIPDRGADR